MVINNMENKTWFIANIDGEKGRSLLHTIETDVARSEEFEKSIEEKYVTIVDRYSDVEDDRLLALIGGLIVENELDDFLSIWIPGYNHLKNERDFSFNLKIELAKALQLIPSRILNSIHPIRKIRNIFAHNLNIDLFKQARDKFPKDFKEFDNKAKSFASIPDGYDDFTKFKYMFFAISFVLTSYSKQLKIVRDYISNDENLNEILRKENY